MRFGGPVWHASAQCKTLREAKVLAFRALFGVGDASLGQWIEEGGANKRTYHLRRRLTADEAALVGPLRDIRGTQEERDRLTALLRAAPHLARYFKGL